LSSVSIQDLRVRLGNLDIIEALNLEVIEGEFLVLLGPSGCGKSTLLHAIAGLIDVENGEIEIAGQNVTWADPKDRSIGMVFQSYAL
jgi:multiple sugar transport system ATP-binding protein